MTEPVTLPETCKPFERDQYPQHGYTDVRGTICGWWATPAEAAAAAHLQLGVGGAPRQVSEEPAAVAAQGLTPEADRSAPDGQQRVAQEEPLPTPYARVNAMGHSTFLGPVTALSRGYRVQHHAVHEVGDGSVNIGRSWHDIIAVHSVDYLTEAQWQAEILTLTNEVERRNEERRRALVTPERYEILSSNARYGFVTPDGIVWGWWWTPVLARQAAWLHAGDREEDISGSPRGPVGAASAEAPDPSEVAATGETSVPDDEDDYAP